MPRPPASHSAMWRLASLGTGRPRIRGRCQCRGTRSDSEAHFGPTRDHERPVGRSISGTCRRGDLNSESWCGVGQPLVRVAAGQSAVLADVRAITYQLVMPDFTPFVDKLLTNRGQATPTTSEEMDPFARVWRSTASPSCSATRGEVLAEVEHRDIVPRRRDGENLFLGLRSQEESVRHALGVLARLLLAASVDPDSRRWIAGALAASLPWTFLPRRRARGVLYVLTPTPPRASRSTYSIRSPTSSRVAGDGRDPRRPQAPERPAPWAGRD